jgi:hypothetical protein
MGNQNLNRRLERLEAELTPGEEQVLTITVTHIGDKQRPTRTYDLVLPLTNRQRRYPTGDGGFDQ